MSRTQGCAELASCTAAAGRESASCFEPTLISTETVMSGLTKAGGALARSFTSTEPFSGSMPGAMKKISAAKGCVG